MSGLYPTLLGPAFDTLPAPLRAFHKGEISGRWTGRATVTRGHNPLARLVATLFGFPRAGADQPAEVTVTVTEHGETWHRRNGNSRYHSHQSPGPDGTVIERFGPFRFALHLAPSRTRLTLIPLHWHCFGLPMPGWALPSGDSFEHGGDGRFKFDITVRAPLLGLIVAYRGWLIPENVP